MKFFRRILPLAMALLVILASLPSPERGKALTKILYIIQDPKNFSQPTDTQILTYSYPAFKETFKEEGRIRTSQQGANYDTCGPAETCDRIAIVRDSDYQLITVGIICGKQSETEELPSGEVNNIEEIQGILLKLRKLVGKHDEQQHR